MDNFDTEHHRLTNVIRAFWCYTKPSQGDLAERAILWALSSLLPHERRNECKADFFALVDLMFLSTDEAQKTLTDSERLHIEVDAEAVQDRLTECVKAITSDSLKRLRALADNDPRRVTAVSLMEVRRGFLAVAELAEQRDLIAHCFAMCVAVDGYEASREAGYGNLDVEERQRLQKIVAVFNCCSHIFNTEVESVKNGRLLVQDGKFVMPQRESDGDE